MEWKFIVGEMLELENEDGMVVIAQVVHRTLVHDKPYYIVRLDTGLTIPYSEDELDRMCKLSY